MIRIRMVVLIVIRILGVDGLQILVQVQGLRLLSGFAMASGFRVEGFWVFGIPNHQYCC